MSIADYVKAKDEYLNYPGRIINGEMFVLYKGKWIALNEFNQSVKAPCIPNLKANLNNSDRTKLWMYSE